MAFFQAKQVRLQKAIPTAMDGVCVVPIVGEFVIPAGFANGDVVEMGGLPPGHIPVDAIFHWPDIDSNGTPTVTADIGLVTGQFGLVLGSRDCGNQFVGGSTVPRTGGVDRVNKSLSTIEPTDTERGWGFKVTAAIATLATGGKVRAVLYAAPAPQGADFA